MEIVSAPRAIGRTQNGGPRRRFTHWVLSLGLILTLFVSVDSALGTSHGEGSGNEESLFSNNPFEVLGLSSDELQKLPPAEIEGAVKKARNQLLLKYHPDKIKDLMTVPAFKTRLEQIVKSELEKTDAKTRKQQGDELLKKQYLKDAKERLYSQLVDQLGKAYAFVVEWGESANGRAPTLDSRAPGSKEAQSETARIAEILAHKYFTHSDTMRQNKRRWTEDEKVREKETPDPLRIFEAIHDLYQWGVLTEMTPHGVGQFLTRPGVFKSGLHLIFLDPRLSTPSELMRGSVLRRDFLPNQDYPVGDQIREYINRSGKLNDAAELLSELRYPFRYDRQDFSGDPRISKRGHILYTESNDDLAFGNPPAWKAFYEWCKNKFSKANTTNTAFDAEIIKNGDPNRSFVPYSENYPEYRLMRRLKKHLLVSHLTAGEPPQFYVSPPGDRKYLNYLSNLKWSGDLKEFMSYFTPEEWAGALDQLGSTLKNGDRSTLIRWKKWYARTNLPTQVVWEVPARDGEFINAKYGEDPNTAPSRSQIPCPVRALTEN